MRITRLRCEPLEPREMPAGTVHAAFAGGVLTLTGDDFDNAVELRQTAGGIEVLGSGGTAITGGPLFGGVTAVKAALADGNDSLIVTPDVDFTLAGTFTADLGDGNNQLALVTSKKLELGGLNVKAGDGQDIVTIGGGPGAGSKITGAATLALGVGINSQSPPYFDTQVMFTNIDLPGTAGLKFTALDGDETLTFTGVHVAGVLDANGGDGSTDVVATDSSFGSMKLNSVGRQPGNPFDGTTLTANNVTVTGALNMKSGAGVRLEFAGSTGSVGVTAGPAGFTNVNFAGTTKVNGNLLVNGFRHTVTAVAGADVTVTGDLTVNAGSYASLLTSEATLRAKNITLNGTGGADFNAFDSDKATGAKLEVAGTMTIKGRTATYMQTGGENTFGVKLALVGQAEAEFSTSTGFYFDAPRAKTTVTNGNISVTAHKATFRQSESDVTTKTGLSIIGLDEALVELTPRSQTEDPLNAGVFDAAVGAHTTVTAGGLQMQGADSAEYFQTGGEATFATGMSVMSSAGGATVRAEVGDGYNAPGPSLKVTTGALLVQGTSAEFRQSGGTGSFATGLSLVGTGGVQFNVENDETHDLLWNFSDVLGSVSVPNGALTAKGGTGEAHFSAGGQSLAVGKDLMISGQGHNRVRFDATDGAQVGGNFNLSGATVENDWLIVTSNFNVAKNAALALGSGANFVDLGGSGGTISVGGNLTVLTGNGSDVVRFRSLSVTGTTTINTGAGSDLLTVLGATTFGGSVTVDLGAGSDTAALGNVVGAAGPVTFNGKATIKLNSGNDQLLLGLANDVINGGDANSRVAFGAAGALTVDGGANLNWFDDEAGQFDGTKSTLLNFLDPNGP